MRFVFKRTYSKVSSAVFAALAAAGAQTTAGRPVWADAHLQSNVPLHDTPVGADAGDDRIKSSIPTGLSRKEGDKRSSGTAEDIQIGAGFLTHTIDGAKTRTGAMASIDLSGQILSPEDPDDWTEDLRRKPSSRARAWMSAKAGSLFPDSQGKARLIGEAKLGVEKRIGFIGGATLDPNYFRFGAGVFATLPLLDGNLAIRPEFGTESLSSRDPSDDWSGHAGGAYGQLTLDAFLGPNVSLFAGAKTGKLVGEMSRVNLIEAEPLPYHEIESVEVDGWQRSAFARARISTDRDRGGTVFYIEPSAVYERTTGMNRFGEPDSQTSFTTMVNVGFSAGSARD